MRDVLQRARVFETADINLAATLCSLGAGLSGINRENPDHCLFRFEDSDWLQRIVELYWRHQLTCDPQTVLQSLKSLKSRLYNEV